MEENMSNRGVKFENYLTAIIAVVILVVSTAVFMMLPMKIAIKNYHHEEAEIALPADGVGMEMEEEEGITLYAAGSQKFVFTAFNEKSETMEEEETQKEEYEEFLVDEEKVVSYGWKKSFPGEKYIDAETREEKEVPEGTEYFEVVFKKESSAISADVNLYTTSTGESNNDFMEEEDVTTKAETESSLWAVPFNTETPERLTHYDRVPKGDGWSKEIQYDDEANKILYFTDGSYAPYREKITISNVTSYCSCAKCCGIWSGYGCTKSEHMFQWSDHFVATDVNYLSWFLGRDIPFGTHIFLEGQIYSIEDTGVSGSWIDIWAPTHELALHHGMTYDVPCYIFD